MKAHTQLRESWLNRAVGMFAKHFDKVGYTIPANVRVSCGLPSSRAFAKKKRAIGEAWSSLNSRDKHHEIFISPTIDEADEVLATLAHELVHVTVGLQAGHKGAFVECARAIGLAGQMTATHANDALAKQIKAMIGELGKYPHGSLEHMTNLKKKQGTRLIKCECPKEMGGCGYTVRVTMMWLLTGAPKCPNEVCNMCGDDLVAELPDPEGEKTDRRSIVKPRNKGIRSKHSAAPAAPIADPAGDAFLDEAGKL